jgi:hypothetical protein
MIGKLSACSIIEQRLFLSVKKGLFRNVFSLTKRLYFKEEKQASE